MRGWIMAAGLALAGCMPQSGGEPTGAEDFATFCAGCHGSAGKGDGPAAAGLASKPADLTRLSARNCGTFPGTRVMSKVWGYAGGPGAETPMPAFAPLVDGRLVPYDGGDGIATPTPVRLVGLAEYVRSLQE